MNAAPKIVIVGSEPAAREELQEALASLSSLRPIIYSAKTDYEGIETARSRQPDLVLVEIGRDMGVLRAFAEEVKVVAPQAVVVAVFHPSIFDPEKAESSLVIEAFRAGVGDFLRRPISSDDLETMLLHTLRRSESSPRPLGKVIAFFTNKGGVGKSTLSVNVASRLAQRRPGKVLLVDASLQFGICDGLLDLKPQTTLSHAAREFDRLDDTLLRELAVPHPCGLSLLAAPPNALEAASVDDDVIARVITLGRRSFDVVVVDTFPMIDRVMMAILDLTDRAYIVSESTVPVLHGTQRLIAMLNEMGYPPDKRRVILNRYASFLGGLTPQSIMDEMKFRIDHVVPYDKRILIAANTGEPFALRKSWIRPRFTRAVERIVDEIDLFAEGMDRSEGYPGRANGSGPNGSGPEAHGSTAA